MSKSIDTPNNAQTSRILGVDFGLAKIGLAIADEETKMAFAYDTLDVNSKLWDNILEIIKCENVKVIVVGITKHEKDKKSLEIKERFWETLKKLAQKESAQVYSQEEMFTTLSAQRNIKMREQKNIVKFDDQEAARIILQDWLDS